MFAAVSVAQPPTATGFRPRSGGHPLPFLPQAAAAKFSSSPGPGCALPAPPEQHLPLVWGDAEAEAAPFWAWRPLRAPPEAGIPGWAMTTVVIRVGRGWSGSATAPSEEVKDDYWKRRKELTTWG